MNKELKTITVQQFINDNYVDAIKAGECIVLDTYGDKVVNVREFPHRRKGLWDYWVQCEIDNPTDEDDGSYGVYENDTARNWFSVTWLPEVLLIGKRKFKRLQPNAQAAEDTATAATAGERVAGELRKQIDNLDAVYYSLGDSWTDEERKRYNEASFELHLNLPARLRVVLDNHDQAQAELATARKQVAALTGAIKTALEFVSSAWDKNDASVVVKDYRYLTETLNFTEAALQDVLFKSDEK